MDVDVDVDSIEGDVDAEIPASGVDVAVEIVVLVLFSTTGETISGVTVGVSIVGGIIIAGASIICDDVSLVGVLTTVESEISSAKI